jgi:hypothetical protein
MKTTYHALVRSLSDSFDADYQTSEQPFDFAPLDTSYGQDFDVMVYTDADTKSMDNGEIALLVRVAAKAIEKSTGMTFYKAIIPKPISEYPVSPLFDQFTPLEQPAKLQTTKLTYHFLLTPTPNGPLPYSSETYKKPFNFEPFDTLYGQDFDLMIYLGNEGQGNVDDGSIMFAGCMAAMNIEKGTGLFFLKWDAYDGDLRLLKD